MYRATLDFHDTSRARLKAHTATVALFAPLNGVGGTYLDLNFLPLGNQSH